MPVLKLLLGLGKLLLCRLYLSRALGELLLPVLVLLHDALYRVARSGYLIFVHELLSLNARPQQRGSCVLTVCAGLVILRLHVKIELIRWLYRAVYRLYLFKLCLALGILCLGGLELFLPGGIVRPALL